MFSDKNTTITDDINFYSLKKFKFLIDEEQLSGEKIIINSNYKLPDNDKYYFSSGIVDFKNNSFVAKDTEVKIHKSIFNNSNNDPRIKGVSSKKNGNVTTISKGVFTSCKENDKCPPWVIEASEIRHDKLKNK